MAITMKEKFDSIKMSKLPENYKAEFEAIKKDSKDFNPKFVPIFQENFDMLYGLVEKKHPEALQKGGVIKKARPTKVKKVVPKAEKTMVHKSRGKKKPEPEKAPASGDGIEDCRKALSEAGYTTKKRLSKDGKKAMKVKEPRPERTIIKDKVEDVFKTINNDISGSEEKDEKYHQMQKMIENAQELLTKLLQMLNNLAADNSMEKVEKIISLLKKIVP